MELVETLRSMVSASSAITARAVVRRMPSVPQASTITRDRWRAALITEYRDKQGAPRPAEIQYGDQLSELISAANLASCVADFPGLRYFATVARAGNIGGAARELGVSQPAVSRQIRNLEVILGTKLVTRHARGVTPTRAGADFLTRLDAPPGPAHAATTGVLPAAGNSFRLAVSPEIGLLLVPPLIAELREQCPSVTLLLREGVSAALEEWLLNGGADIAILPEPPSAAELVAEPVLMEPLGLVASRHNVLAQGSDPVRLRDLAGTTLILPSQQHYIRRRLMRAARQRGNDLTPDFEVDSLPTIKAMVREGLGCTVLPRMAVQDDASRGVLVFRPISQPSLVMTQAVVSRRTGGREDAGIVGNIIRDILSGLIEKGQWAGAKLTRPIARQAFTGAR